MADVFISYKRQDKAMAEQLAEALGQLGFDVWWDFDLLSGDQYRKVIREVINQCKAAVVLWSALAVESDFVMDEASHAKGMGKLCPARIDQVELPFGFGQMHTDDLSDWEGELSHTGFQALVRAIEGRVGRKGRLGQKTSSPDMQAASAELDAFKAAQTAGTAGALKTFLRAWPRGAFAGFVRGQLQDMGDAPVAPTPTPVAAPARVASPDKRSAAPGKSRWPAIALGLAVLAAAGGGLAYMTLNRKTETQAAASPAPVATASATPASAMPDAASVQALAAVEENNAWRIASGINSIASYEAYLTTYPSGAHADGANDALTALKAAETSAAQQDAARLQKQKDDAARNARDQSDRDLAARNAARDTADDSAWSIARSANTVSAFDAYLGAYPYGRHAGEARTTRTALANPPKPTYAPYDVAQLHPDVRRAVETARATKTLAENAATRARDAAAKAEAAALRARNGEKGFRAFDDSANPKNHWEGGPWEKNNQLNGYAIRTVLTGSWAGHRYAGEWRNSIMSGVGVSTMAQVPGTTTRTHFEGEYAGGTNNGVGVLAFDSNTHSGSFKDGTSNGPGVRDSGTGRFEGEFRDNNANGFAVLWTSRGEVYQAGVWTNGKLTTPLALAPQNKP